MTTERDREMAREWLLKTGIPFDYEEDALADLLAMVRAEVVQAERERVVRLVHSWADVQEEDADDSDEAEHCANVLRALASAVADVTPREAEEGKGT